MSSELLKESIFDYLKKLPKRKKISDKFLAEKFNSHPRAVAKILSCNKDKSVHCYKVIKNNRELGGYNFLLEKSKQELLKSEGIKIKKGLVV